MIAPRLTLTACVVFGALLLTTGHAAPPELDNNPFARPSALAAPTGVAPLEHLETPPPRLLATMVSSKRQLANVEGKVVEIGDTIRGYVLTQVFDDRATFEYRGSELVVRVKPDPEENDE